MKNWSRIFVIVLSILVVQSFGSVASDQCISPIDPGSVNVPATGIVGHQFSVSSAPLCYWAPTGFTYSPVVTVPWITISDYYWLQSGSGFVNIDVAPTNVGDPAREGAVHIGDIEGGSATYIVSQAANCYVKYLRAPTAADSVFVTSPDCATLVEIFSGDPDSIKPVVTDPLPLFAGIEYGPDRLLYVSDTGGGIFSIVPGDTEPKWNSDSATGFEPNNARFNSNGDLIVADGAGGLKAFENDPARWPGINLATGYTEVSDSASFGGFVDVTTAVNGDLLGLTSDSVVRFRYQPPTIDNDGYYENGERLPSDLGKVGAHAIARTSSNKIVVAAGSTLTVFTADGTSSSHCRSFDGKTIYGLEPAADDTLYATVVDDIDNSGELFEIPFNKSDPFCDVPKPLAEFSGGGGSSQPVYGVAVPFSSQIGDYSISSEFSFPEGTWAFSFNEQVYEIRPELSIPLSEFEATCDFEVTAQEVDPVYLQGLILREPWGVSQVPVIFEGENGRGLIYDYDVFSTHTDADTDTDESVTDEECRSYVDKLSHAINGYYYASSPTPVVCHDDPLECYETIFLSTSGSGYLPEDGRTRGVGGGDFSFTFLEDRSGNDPVYAGNFCGFSSPLDDATAATPLIANGGSTVPIGFLVSETKNCKKGPFIDGITAVLSVAQIDPVFKPIDAEDLVIVGGGSSEDDRIVFNVPVSSKKGYDLQFKTQYADGTPFEAGATFEITVTDDSGMYFPFQTAYITIAN